MNKKLNIKNFSMKKLLLTILCTVIVSVFVGSTGFFIWAISQQRVGKLDEKSEELIKIGKQEDSQIEGMEQTIKEMKDIYGEDYPAGGILLYKIVIGCSTSIIISIFPIFVMVGIVLGTLIYIIAVQNSKGLDLMFECYFAAIILIILVIGLNLGYQVMMAIVTGDEEYVGVFDEDEVLSVGIPIYIATVGIIYIANMVRQKIIANRLNKQLNNNTK